MRIPTLIVNIFLPASIAVGVVAGWIWATGSFAVSVPSVIGLALAAGGASVVAEWLIWQTVHAVRRRTRPSRHRRLSDSPRQGRVHDLQTRTSTHPEGAE